MICKKCKKDKNEREFVGKYGRIRVTCETCAKKNRDKRKKCKKLGCLSEPVFNILGEKPLFCGKHKTKEMVDVKHKKCIHDGCMSQPIYNIFGEEKALYCKVHKTKEMVNVKDRKCKYAHCQKTPKYNKPTETGGIYCVEHKDPDMINVAADICLYEDCMKSANYNFSGQKRGLYCSAHKKDSMILVTLKLCLECSSVAAYNMPSETKVLYCKTHKKDGMIRMRKRCSNKNCKSFAYYGIPANKPTCCFRHKKDNMIRNPNKRCCHNSCSNTAVYGINTAQHCEIHKEPTEISLVERICKKCGIIDRLSSNELCINTCELSEEFKKYRKYIKRKQLRVQKILTEKIAEPDRIEESIDTDCGRERIDFMYECKTHNIAIEPDEFQHRDRCQLGEFNRMKNIFFALGQDVPLIFIRYNPDNYRVDNVLQKTPQSKREDELIRWVKHYMENIPENICSVLYLFYDEYSQENVKVYPFDPYNTETFSCDECDEVFYIESMFDDHKCQ